MKPTIGIEVHVELKSCAKAFSNSQNSFSENANTNVNLIDLGYPGTLPMLNQFVVKQALKAALALNCQINKNMHFDRKNYFYPDLPKGYQITQKDTPIGFDGYLEIEIDNTIKKIAIERIHIEEDTCKSIHSDNTLLNFNRSGVPLIEIVTKPVISSGEEAKLYVEKLREILLHLGVSDVKIEEGSMRCDVNVSVSATEQLGTKCEVKNIGSISNVKLAVDYEIKRQTDLINSGIKIVEETRRFDDKNNQTVLMRIKETGNDYRYFPEPDLAPLILSDQFIEEIKNSLPINPNDLRKIYLELGINEKNTNTIIADLELCHFLESIRNKTDLVIAANFLTGDISSYLNKNFVKLNQTKLTSKKMLDLVNSIQTNLISSKQAKELIPELLETDLQLVELITKLGLEQINDTDSLLKIINTVISNNPESVKDYKDGKDRAIKYLMGQIMKESKGQANPSLVGQLLIEEITKY